MRQNEATGRTRFDLRMDGVRESLVAMGGTCEEMLRDALTALVQQDLALVKDVLRRDDEVDAFEQSIEKQSLSLLTLQQPVLARDLRFVSMALKATTDIERIGDHCVNIAKTARRMNQDHIVFEALVDIERLGQIAITMLHDTIDAFVRNDEEKAREVVQHDDEADVLYGEFQRELRTMMLSGEPGAPILRASYLLFVAHYLERICDHCVGIAEWVIFAETGEKSDTTGKG